MITIICQKHPITAFILFSTLSVFATWFLLLIVIMDWIWKCRSKLGLYLKLSRLLIATRVQIPIGRQMLPWETVMFIRPMCVQDFQPFYFSPVLRFSDTLRRFSHIMFRLHFMITSSTHSNHSRMSNCPDFSPRPLIQGGDVVFKFHYIASEDLRVKLA